MRSYPSTVLSDVLDNMNRPQCILPAEIRSECSHSMAGRARTIQISSMISSEENSGDIYHSLHFIEQLEPGDILVVAVDPPLRNYAFFGGLMAALSERVGLGGIIIDGKTRDWDSTVDKKSFPIFSRGYYPQDMHYRGVVRQVDCEVIIGSWPVVRPGDYMFGDADGIVVVPFELSLEVFARADKVISNEVIIEDLITDGIPMKQILDERGDF
ncbi:unnamed protein product [marine sediment metagenome]|uniref:Dimethylmenaquinone methyltransferase n=1 Tax=marine sediment metagenome TaxID=412755 RepID=X0RVW5_9ZZZZ